MDQRVSHNWQNQPTDGTKKKFNNYKKLGQSVLLKEYKLDY